MRSNRSRSCTPAEAIAGLFGVLRRTLRSAAHGAAAEETLLRALGFEWWNRRIDGLFADRPPLTRVTLGATRPVIEAHAKEVDGDQYGALMTLVLVCRDLGDRHDEANALDHLGDIARYRDQHDKATQHHHDALTIYREIGDRQGEANALKGLAEIKLDLRNYGDAASYFSRALAIYRDIGDDRMVNGVLELLARLPKLPPS
jgi:tetratricopeptide (TPR) repeat protein